VFRRPVLPFAAAFLAALVSLAASAGVLTAGIPILVYHRFDRARPGPTTVTDAVFEQQLDWLTAHRYRILPLRSVVAALRGDLALSPPAAAITIDDGHASQYSQLYPIIRQRRIPVTLFIYPSAISRASYALTWGQLADMLKSGLVEVQSHTYWHPDFRKEKASRSPEDYRAFVDFQLSRSKAVLEDRLGIKVDMLAWPFGIHDPELEAAAARAGYKAAFAFKGGPAHRGGDPFAISRIPVSDAARGAGFAALLTETPSRKRQP
jgi:peptidoglycan/xylan/chitin deacetylase (PgdA/CDA1 family)